MTTEHEPDDAGESTERMYDAPNQQVVREDESGPADEGTGGTTPDPNQPGQPQPGQPQPDPNQPQPGQPQPEQPAPTG